MAGKVYETAYKIYKSRLERISLVRVVAEAAYLGLRKISLLFFGTRYLATSLTSADLESIPVQAIDSQKVPDLTFFGPEGISPRLRSSNEYSVPEVRSYKIREALVIGATDFVLTGKTLLFDEGFSPKNHVSTLERFSIGRFERSGRGCRLIRPAMSRWVGEAINLTSGGSGNFAHCLNENLAKLLLVEEVPELKGIPLLVDDCLSKNLRDLLMVIKSPDREVIPVGRFELLQVGTLHQLSNPAFAPLDIKVPTETFGDFTTFSGNSVRLLREKLDEIYGSFDLQTYKKYFFSRHSNSIDGFQENLRYVANQMQIEEHLIDIGFEKIDLESLGLNEIITLMRGASVVVSPIGAALSNTIFAPPGTLVIALAPFYNEADYTYHARMMAAYEHRYVVAVGHQVVAAKKPNPNLPFNVEIRHLASALSIS